MRQNPRISVLTGDIVGSTSLGTDATNLAMETLQKRAKIYQHWFGSETQFSQHRGDGWQIALHEPAYALRCALDLRATLRSLGKEFKTRIAVATDDVVLPLKSDLNHENQKVFIRSGRLLEQYSVGKKIECLRSDDDRKTQANFILADHISSKWTPKQSRVLMYTLAPLGTKMSNKQIAEEIGISRQAVSKAHIAAGGLDLDFALITLEVADKDD